MSYIHTHLPVNAIVTLPHPRSGDRQGRETFIAPSADNQTRSYETEYSKHHPSLSTLRSKGLSHSKMKWWDSYMHTNLPVNASKITSKLPVNYIYKYIYIYIYQIITGKQGEEFKKMSILVYTKPLSICFQVSITIIILIIYIFIYLSISISISIYLSISIYSEKNRILRKS